MRTGMNLLLWTTFVTEKDFPLLETLADTGFDGVEFPLGEGDQAHYTKMRNKLEELDLGCTTVTSLAPETNAVSPDENVRKAAVERLKWAIDMTAVLDGEVMCGPFHSAFKSFTGKGPTADEKKWSAEVLYQAADHAEKCGVLLAVEPINRFECYFLNTIKDAKALVERVGHPYLKVLYDTHHSNIEEKNAADSIQLCANVLGHVHISENDRGTPGKGQVIWKETFDTLKKIQYDGWMVIESFSTVVPEFASAINVWRDFDPSRQIATEGLRFIEKMWQQG